MIGLRPEKEEEYRRLHANVWPEVRAAIRKANIRDDKIHIGVVNGKNTSSAISIILNAFPLSLIIRGLP